jgi:hypothetical protein
MKSAKKVRVPRNKKITPKRKKMRSKPRKQSKKRKHRGGENGAPCDPMKNDTPCRDDEWCKPNTLEKNKGTCQERMTAERALELLKQGYPRNRIINAKYNNNLLSDKRHRNFTNCELLKDRDGNVITTNFNMPKGTLSGDITCKFIEGS